jgi:tetratricopeptide (TPR) repeat protein
MSVNSDYWMYLVDDDILNTLLSMDPSLPKAHARPVTCRELTQAVMLHLEGRSPQAIALLQETLDHRKAVGQLLLDLRSTLGQVQFESGDPAAAEASFRALLEHAPEHPTAAYNLGVCLERLERWEEAAVMFEAQASRPAAPVEARLGAGICRMHLGEPAAALAAFDALLVDRPDHETGLFGRAVALQQLDRYDEAVAAYTKVMAHRPDAPEVHNNMIALGLATDDYALVQEHAARLLSLRRHSRPALEGLLASAITRADWEEASRYAGDLLKAAPDSFEGWYNRGVAAQKLGRLGESASAYLRAAEIRPNDPAPLVNRAAALAETGDEAGAREAYHAALAIAPEPAQIQWNLAVLAVQFGELEAAERCLEKVVAQWPEAEEAWFQLGWVRLEQARHEPASAAFEQALDRRSEWPEALFNLALARWRSGDSATPAELFERCLATAELTPAALRALSALALEGCDTGRARHWFAMLGPAGSAVPELSYNLGRLIHLEGDAAEAIPFYRQALSLAPNMPEALANLAIALDQTGEKTQADAVRVRARTHGLPADPPALMAPAPG